MEQLNFDTKLSFYNVDGEQIGSTIDRRTGYVNFDEAIKGVFSAFPDAARFELRGEVMKDDS